jgi:ferredoxin
MKISINYELCNGHGRCYTLAPELFGSNEEGQGEVCSPAALLSPESIRKAEIAISSCPEEAITLLD